jgi:organic radical activating enzyme
LQNTRLSNLDPTQQRLHEEGLLLPVMEIFYSVQGEGFNTGKPAAFVRIGGCDVGCHWCDIKESWDASVHPLTGVDQIVENVCAFPANAVVITGGEPLMYNLDVLCQKLQNRNIRIFLETSGAFPLSGAFDWVCLSPKSNHPPLDSMLALADELKVIIHDDSDFHWAEENATKVSKDCILYLQPEWSQVKTVLPQIIRYVKSNPEWMVSIQSHKYMNIP